MSAADGLVRNEEVAGATPATLTIFGRQADTSWLHLSRKQDRHGRGRSITDAFRQFSTANLNKRKSHETRSPLPKPVALPQELQTQSPGSYSVNAEGDPRVSTNATLRFETATGNRLVA